MNLGYRHSIDGMRPLRRFTSPCNRAHPTRAPIKIPAPGGVKPALGRPSALRAQRGSVLIIVLWIALGLVTLALYFAQSMNFELRASDNRVSAQAADQAIEGAVRYVNYLLSAQITNGSNG